MTNSIIGKKVIMQKSNFSVICLHVHSLLRVVLLDRKPPAVANCIPVFFQVSYSIPLFLL